MDLTTEHQQFLISQKEPPPDITHLLMKGHTAAIYKILTKTSNLNRSNL